MNYREIKRPRVFWSDDYAGMQFQDGRFYYGYEVTEGEGEDVEWCFQAKIDGLDTITIPASKLGVNTDDQFDVVQCLLTGIGWVLTKYPPRALEES